MTARDEVIGMLSEQQELTNKKGPELRAEWQSSVQRLMEQIRAWLKEPAERRLLRVENETADVTEGLLGNYEAAALKITTPKGDVVKIFPKARIVVGAFGRVDFECGPSRATLVRKTQQTWQFAKLGLNRWEYTDFGEESFWETLRGLIS